MRVVALLGAAGLLALAAWSCDGDADPSDDADHAKEAAVTVIARNTTFEPRDITVSSGDEVTLQLENRDAFEHDFQVDGLEVEVIAGGSDRPEHGGGHGGASRVIAVHTNGDETDSITFLADAPGTYDFYCTIPGHKDSGMFGTFTVQ